MQIVLTIALLLITRRRNKSLQTNDWAEILSHIINCMNLEQFEEVEMRIFLVEKISTSLQYFITNFIRDIQYHFSRLEMHDVLSNT